MPGIWDGTELHAISTEIKSALHPEELQKQRKKKEEVTSQQQQCSCSLMAVVSLFLLYLFCSVLDEHNNKTTIKERKECTRRDGQLQKIISFSFQGGIQGKEGIVRW